MNNMYVVIVVILALSGLLLGNAEKLDQFTFQPPFAESDISGTRLVGDNWKTSGTTVVNKNFIRLTPDRQSKKGSIWSRKPLGVPSFSAILQFRISGQGKNFFGDGIAFWITQHGYNIDGILHGSTESFVGIGIVFDTFKNTENLAAHRDVTILINDGRRTYEAMTEDVLGCSARVRYHAERADFSVTDSSRAKVVLEHKKLHVYIDADNSNNWESCVMVEDVDLPDNWTSRAYVGLTATTGALADNHDIISLKVFSDATVMEQDEALAADASKFELAASGNVDEQMKTLAEEVNKILKNMEVLDHHVEHELASVSDHIRNLINKVSSREDNAEDRIEQLESLVKKEVAGSLDARLTSLEKQMQIGVDRKMSNIESSLDRKMDRLQMQADDYGKSNAGSWKLPFLFLFILVLAAAGGVYYFYEKMRKMHLL